MFRFHKKILGDTETGPMNKYLINTTKETVCLFFFCIIKNNY
jgi:hypothetical protein